MSERGDLGARLRAYRQAAGLTQQDVAERLTGWREDHADIARYESGRRRPGRTRLLGLARAFGLTDYERDRLLVLAGYPPLDPLGYALGHEPALLALARLLAEGRAPAPLRETVREFARLAVRQAAMLAAMREEEAT